MDSKFDRLDDFLAAVLRGAAKILGCHSTSLVVINEKTGEIRLRVAVPAVSYPVLAGVEGILGESVKGFSFPLVQAQDSLIARAWRDGTVYESGSLAELVGTALPEPVTRQMEGVIGEHRYILVPARSNIRNYGVLLFEKEGRESFSLQQRELVLRYARRIGEIIENDLMGQEPLAFVDEPAEVDEFFLFDQDGRRLGGTSQGDDRQELQADLGLKAAQFLREGRAGAVESGKGSLANLRLFRLDLSGKPAALCRVKGRAVAGQGSLENQLLQLALGAAAPAVFVDPGFHVTSCNEATQKLFGYAAAELVGQPITALFRDPQAILEVLNRQLLAPGHPSQEERTLIRRRDQSLAEARVEAMLLADDQDKGVGFLVLIRENTEGAPSEMVSLVQQERLATMGEMAAQLAHEVRNPLLAIGASLDLMSRELLDQRHQERLATLAREIVRMDMILRKYLVVRKAASEGPVRLREVAEEARQLLEGARKQAGKKISAAVPPELTVWGDHESLKHLLFNLLLNALEASPPGGEVVCRAESSEHDVSIFVEDRGPGLAAPEEECFRPFFTTKNNGTGLGLSVSQKIALSHGGVVKIRNREGGGCQAQVILPLRTVDAGGGTA